MIKILVVDDENDVEFLFLQQFRKEIRNKELEFNFAFSGEEALKYMKTLDPFDIVLLMSDINMPGMTGLELLKQTRPMFPELKIIMVTAYDDEKNYKTSIEYGADDFITKPVDFELLKKKMTELKSK
jgi:two-component system chemotaxis response regulator CheY